MGMLMCILALLSLLAAISASLDLSDHFESCAAEDDERSEGARMLQTHAVRISLQPGKAAIAVLNPVPTLTQDLAADATNSSDADWEMEDQDTIARMDAWADSDTDTTFIRRMYTGFSQLVVGTGEVVCGNHRAATCADCPQGHGEGWCHGECVWKDNKCSKHGMVGPYGCSPSGECEARTCSIHFNFMRPSGALRPSWFYNEVKPTLTSSASYFATATTAYGYAGLQTIWKDTTKTNDRAVICSTSDEITGSAAFEKCGSDVKCVGYGGEGTGAKSMWYFDWTLGKKYAFMMHRRDVGNGRIEQTCWFYAEELEDTFPGGWKHLATTTTGAKSGVGSTFLDVGSFVEQWTYQHSDEPRRSEFGPAYYKNEDGAWHQSRIAKFSHYWDQERLDAGKTLCDYVSAGQAAGTRRLYMATGGTTLAPEALRRARDLAYPEVENGFPTPLNQFEASKKALLEASKKAVCGGLVASGSSCSQSSASTGLSSVGACLAKIQSECPSCNYFSFRASNGACHKGIGTDPGCDSWTYQGGSDINIYKSCHDATSDDCDYQCYLDRYADLQKVLGPSNTAAAARHWKSHGKKEGRHCSCKDEAPACNWQCYLDRYADLQKVLGPRNTAAAARHWESHGKKAGRDCTCKDEPHLA